MMISDLSTEVISTKVSRGGGGGGGGGGVSESMERQGCAILALELVPKNLISA